MKIFEAKFKRISLIIPIKKRNRELIQEIKNFSKQHTLGKLDWKTLRDEGRR